MIKSKTIFVMYWSCW